MPSSPPCITLPGACVPSLGFGTWRLSGEACREAVAHALSLGYRHVDTAASYGNEREVGAALRESGVPREEIFLTTKVWWDQLRRADVLRSAAASLERLGVERVELLLVHWPNPQVPLEETLDAFREVQEAGLTRFIGVSNFPPSLLRRALALAPIRCNQVEYHPFLSQQPLLEIARAHDLMLTAYRPISDVAGDPTLRAIGERHGKSAVQVALRWLLQQDRVAALPRSADPAHRAHNFDVFDFTLSPEEMARIHALASGRRAVNPSWAPDWE